MTAALEGGEWSAARPGRTLPPANTRYPFYRSLGGPQGRSGRAELENGEEENWTYVFNDAVLAYMSRDRMLK